MKPLPHATEVADELRHEIWVRSKQDPTFVADAVLLVDDEGGFEIRFVDGPTPNAWFVGFPISPSEALAIAQAMLRPYRRENER